MNEELLKAIEELLNRKLAPIEQKLNALLEAQPQDIASMIQLIDKKLDSIKKDVEFTYQKVSYNELEINRMKHQ